MYCPFARKSFCHTHTPHNSVRNWQKNLIWIKWNQSRVNSFQAKAWKSHFLTMWPWPLTFTYNPLAKVKVNLHTKNQDHRSNGLTMRVLTHTHTHTHRHNIFQWMMTEQDNQVEIHTIVNFIFPQVVKSTKLFTCGSGIYWFIISHPRYRLYYYVSGTWYNESLYTICGKVNLSFVICMCYFTTKERTVYATLPL